MDNLQDLLNNIKMAAQEGQSAAIDAINAIKQARMLSQTNGQRLKPGSETTIELEPGLTQPKSGAKIDPSTTIIDDPDNLLQSQSQEESQESSDQNQDSTSNDELQSTSNQEDTDENTTNSAPETKEHQDQGDSSEQQNTDDQQSQSDQQSSSSSSQADSGNQPNQNNSDAADATQNSEDSANSSDNQATLDTNPGINDNQQSTNETDNSDQDQEEEDVKDAPNFKKPESDHEAPDKQSLVGRKITIGRVLNLAQTALNKAIKTMTEAVAPSQASIDRIKKDIEDLQNLTDDEITEMSTDKFNELISRALDNIDKISKVDYSNDLETRVKKINQELSDPELAKELSREDALNKQHAAQEAEATQREKDKYTRGHFKSMSQFNIKFYRAIKDQVDEIEDDVDTWGAINKHHSDDGIIAKGTHLEDVPNETIPSVDIYVDCSGSWSDTDIAHGEQILHQILEFERRGEITAHIYYGTNGLFQTKQAAFDAGRGTNFWPEMINNIKAKDTKNVVILTDSDMNYDPTPDTRATVDGVVYWIWRNGSRGENLVKNLRGRRDNDEFEFTASYD